MKNKEKDVFELMKQWFHNKELKKEIKSKRNAFWESGRHEAPTCDRKGDTCIDLIRNGHKDVEKCQCCAHRHVFYLELRQLSYKNGLIMRRVNRLTKQK